MSSSAAAPADHPRIRGEHIYNNLKVPEQAGSSPHTRGARFDAVDAGRVHGIIPAYAGSTMPAPLSPGSGRDHPRIRGEHSPAARECPAALGSSPHTRGARVPLLSLILVGCGSSPHTRGAPIRHSFGHFYPGIIPAYAGSTFPSLASTSARRDHPRIRGEHETSFTGVGGPSGSSPHTRGAHAALDVEGLAARIIPAYAGSTRSGALSTRGARDHPRIRGEHAGFVVKLTIAGRIIPAYAGSTWFRESPTASAADHPRIRGEHSPLLSLRPGGHGSSPHTRGAPRRRLGRGPASRIIPAYAGSTRKAWSAS